MSVALSSAFTDFRRRAFVHGLAASAVAADDPLSAWSRHHAVWELFEDEGDLLAALHEYWVDLLSRRIYGEPHYPLGEERTREVYAALAQELPALREVLERYQEFPALARLVNEERVLLARSAGHLGHASTATLAWRGRDLLDTIPLQRGA